jgi:hypothetical protein
MGEITTWPVMSLARMVLAIAVAGLLLWVGCSIYYEATKKPPTEAMRDVSAVVREMYALLPGETLKVESTARVPYELQLFGVGNTQKECATKPCICVTEKGQQPQCETLDKKYITQDCKEDKPCVIAKHDLGTAQGGIGQPITICRKTNNELHLGDGC